MTASTLISVRAATSADEARIVQALRPILAELKHFQVSEFSQSTGIPAIVLVDGAAADLKRWLTQFNASEQRKSCVAWLWMDEAARLPEALVSGQVDDLLIHPVRPLELLSKLRHFEQQRIVHEVQRMQSALERVLKDLNVDMGVLERLQKSRLPVRFSDVKGFAVASRYIAGQKSGGDYFDLAESADGSQLGILVTDSSSYGLSSAVLTAVARVISRVSVEQARSVREMVRSFYEELLRPLGPQDRLAVFYATLSRKDYVLRFLNLGSIRAFYRAPKTQFVELPTQGGALSQGSRNALASTTLSEASFAWEPGGRLVILSDGFLDALGGSAAAQALLEKFQARDAKDLLNELAFTIKGNLEDPREDLPDQDCTGMVMDLDPKVIRRVT